MKKIMNEDGSFVIALDSSDAAILQALGRHAGYRTGTITDAESLHPCIKNALSEAEVISYVAPVVTLEQAKSAKEAAINAKTDEILMRGVTVSWGGTDYLIDTRGGNRSADNWNDFRYALLSVASGLKDADDVFPRTVYSKDRRPIEIASKEDGDAFMTLCILATQSVLAAGGYLLKQLDACDTVEAVDALEDSRE